jgi:hypothetical protein
MRKFITTFAPLAILTAFTTAINAALAPLLPFKMNLTNDEKSGLRSMAEGREGYARLVSRIATQFPNSLSRADVPTELANLLSYYENLAANRLAILQALETVEEMQLGTAADVMVLVDRYVNNLQISRANDSSLDLAMQDVDNWNSRFANKNTPPPAPPTV